MEGSGGERTSALQARLQARREMFLKAEGAGGGGATPSQVGRDFFKLETDLYTQKVFVLSNEFILSGLIWCQNWF